ESPPREEGCLRHQENFGEAHLSAADGVVAHKSQSGVTENPVRSAATPPHGEGTTLAQKMFSERTNKRLGAFSVLAAAPLQRLYSLQQFRQSLEYGGTLQPNLVIDSRITRHHLSGFDRVWNSGLCRGHDAVSNVEVARDSHLTGKNDVASDLGASSQTD